METDTAKARLTAFIQQHEVAVIATASPAAVPEAALVNIAVSPSFEIIFETTAATRKCANLRDNPRVALVIGWENDQSLQIDGNVEVLEGSARDRLKTIFMDAFPGKRSHEYWPGNDFYRVRPYWARLSNYTRPRQVEEFHFPENMPQLVKRRSWQRIFTFHRAARKQRN